MVIEVQGALEKNNINVRNLLIMLRSSSVVRDRKVPLFDSGIFERIASLDKLFETLSGYWHLFDYDVLMHLIDTAQCEEAKRILYDDFLTSFDSSVIGSHKLILNYDVFKEDSILPGCCTLRVKVKHDKCTAEVVKEVKGLISEHFKLEKYALIFKGIKEGCIELIYQTSHSVKSYMLQYKVTRYDMLHFKTHDIIAFKFENMELNIPEDIYNEVCTAT